MRAFDLSTNHATFDPSTGTFSPAHYERLDIPTDLTIDQFLFSYSPEQAIQPGKDGVGHRRPNPHGQTWLVDSVTNRQYSFENCRNRTEALAHSLYHHLELGHDQVVVIYAPNDIDYPLVIWATFRLGGIISCVNPSCTSEELVYQLSTLSKHFKLAGLVCHPDTLQTAGQAAARLEFPRTKILMMSSLLGPNTPEGIPKEIFTLEGIIEKYQNIKPFLQPIKKLVPGQGKQKLAFLSFSSGTTGLPKAVCIPHFAVIANMIQITRLYDEDASGKKTLAVLPYYHIFGLVVILHAGIYRNLANVVIPKFSLKNFLDCVIGWRPSILYLVPPVVVLLTKSPEAGLRKREIDDAVKKVFSSAAPLTQELITAFHARFPHIELYQHYGLTETSTMVTSAPPMAERGPGASAGVLCPNVRMKFINAQGEPVGFGQTGEICIESPSSALGYLANPKATAETFLPDGFVRTGDEGYIDQRGWVWVVDRLKELIKVKGFQVAPAELEGHILGHPSVADVCVIGIPDEFSGEVPRAFVVKSVKAQKEDPQKLSQEIQKWVSDSKVRFKWLDGGVEFLDSVPKSPSGKILRRMLRAQHVAHLKEKPKL